MAETEEELKVLMVTPSRALSYADEELQRVNNLLHPDILFGGNATSDALMDALGEDYDLVWFAGHSNADGLELEDGPLPADNLIQFMKGTRSTLFLNSCESFPVALQVNEWLKISVIGTISKVEDIKAYQTGVLFARALAGGKSIQEAFELSKPLAAQYVHLPGWGGDDTDVNTLRTELKVLRFIVEDFERNQSRVIEEHRRVCDRRYHPRLGYRSARSWGLGFAIFVVNVFLFYWDVRELFNVSWVVASFGALVLFPVSGYFLMRGMKLDMRPPHVISEMTMAVAAVLLFWKGR